MQLVVLCNDLGFIYSKEPQIHFNQENSLRQEHKRWQLSAKGVIETSSWYTPLLL